jgi:uncharacterized protein DUF998
MEILAKVAVLVLLASGIVLPEVLSYLTDDYSSLSNYLSVLGALGAPFSPIINYFGFLPVGLAIIALIAVLWVRLPRLSTVRSGLICLLGVAIGYLGAFSFPCDPGCPATGTYRQSLHNLAGLLEYVGGVAGLFLLYFGLRSKISGRFPISTLIAACIVTLSVLAMFNPQFEFARGVSQRLADYTIFIWLCSGAVVSRVLGKSKARHSVWPELDQNDV